MARQKLHTNAEPSGAQLLRLLLGMLLGALPAPVDGEFVVSTQHIEGVADNVRDLTEQSIGKTDFQNYVDTLLHDSADSITAQGASQIAEEIGRSLQARRDSLLSLSGAINHNYDTTARARPYPLCETVELGGYSHTHNTRVNLSTWCVAGRALSSGQQYEYLPYRLFADMRAVVDNEPNAIKRVVFGSEQGVYTVYPASRLCPENDDRSCYTEFDPRFAPWYVKMATPLPKDLVLLIDKSQSMSADLGIGNNNLRVDIAKEAAKTVLRTLSPDDRVAVVTFSNEAEVLNGDLDSCFSTQLAQATPLNINKLTDYIYNFRLGGETNYARGLEKAFQYFHNMSIEGQEQRDRVILMLTDGDNSGTNTQEIFDTIRQGNAAVNNKVVIFTYGVGDITDAGSAILANISQQGFADKTVGEVTAGESSVVDDIALLRDQMASYYNLFKNSNKVNEVKVTAPYYDNFEKGLQISMCTQVAASTTLRGVVCLDILLEDVVAKVTYYRRGTQSYGFIVDSQARVLTHPMLPNPNSVQNNIGYTYLSALERGRDVGQLIDALKRRETGNQTLSTQRVLPRGSLELEGVSFTEHLSTYIYHPIPDFDFVLCLVTTAQSTYAPISEQNWPNGFPQFVYHRFSNNPRCLAGSRIALKDHGNIKIAPRAFTNNLRYENTNETRELVDEYKNFFEGRINNQYFKENVRVEVAIASKLNEIVSTRNDYNDHVIWRYFGSDSGVIIVYPGCEIATIYDPAIRPWYSRQVAYRANTVITTPYEDAFGAGIVLSVTCSIKDTQNDLLLGELGLDMSPDYMYYMLTENVPACASNKCFVVDAAGFVVVHHDWINSTSVAVENIHMTYYERDVAAALAEQAIWTSQQCINVEEIRQQVFGKIFLPAEGKYDGDWFEIHKIPDTNTFLVVKKRAAITQSEVKCRCTTTGTDSLRVSQCRSSDFTCHCPCFERNMGTYQYCTNSYSLTVDNPPVCTPPAPSINYTAILSLENVTGLDYCHDYRCAAKTSHSACITTLTCSWCLAGCSSDFHCISASRCPNTTASTCTSGGGGDGGGSQGGQSGGGNSGGGGLPGWGIALVVVVGVLVLAVVVIFVVCLKFVRRSHDRTVASPHEDPYSHIPHDYKTVSLLPGSRPGFIPDHPPPGGCVTRHPGNNYLEPVVQDLGYITGPAFMNSQRNLADGQDYMNEPYPQRKPNSDSGRSTGDCESDGSSVRQVVAQRPVTSGYQTKPNPVQAAHINRAMEQRNAGPVGSDQGPAQGNSNQKGQGVSSQEPGQDSRASAQYNEGHVVPNQPRNEGSPYPASESTGSSPGCRSAQNPCYMEMQPVCGGGGSNADSHEAAPAQNGHSFKVTMHFDNVMHDV